MCCTGKCLYEDHEGECTLPWGTPYPDDALCVQNEREQEAAAEVEAMNEAVLAEAEAAEEWAALGP